MKHPEQKEGEIFLGNYYLKSVDGQKDYHDIGWCSKRLGKQAFSDNGKLLADHAPCFIQRQEVESEIALTRDYRKDILRDWLKEIDSET